MLSIDWEHIYSIKVMFADNTGYQLDIVGADADTIKGYCENALIYASDVHPQATLPIWINWLKVRNVTHRLIFLGNKWKLSYWMMRLLHRLMTRQFEQKPFNEYKTTYGVFEIDE